MDFYAIGTKKHFVGKSVLTLNVMVPNKYVSEPSYDLKFSLYANLTYQIRSVTLFYDAESIRHFREAFLEQAGRSRPLGPDAQPAKGFRKLVRNILLKMSPLF